MRLKRPPRFSFNPISRKFLERSKSGRSFEQNPFRRYDPREIHVEEDSDVEPEETSDAEARHLALSEVFEQDRNKSVE